ncbi:MAG: hypothetical protein ACFCVB_14850 [Nodosilinea sp.]
MDIAFEQWLNVVVVEVVELAKVKGHSYSPKNQRVDALTTDYREGLVWLRGR